MKELLESLNLDAESLIRRREWAAGFGQAYRTHADNHPDPQLIQVAAATSFRRAAADSLLLDDFERARTLFQDSANSYEAAGSSFAVAISQLGIDTVRRKYSDQGEKPCATDVYALFGAESLGAMHFHPNQPATERFDSMRSVRVGILGTPVSSYLDLFDAMVRRDRQQLREALFPFVAGYNDVFVRAIGNSFHWSLQAMPFHPLEPEVLSLLVAVSRSAGDEVVEFIEGSGMNRIARSCLQQALLTYVGSSRRDYRV
jgi:hypothetical protein